MKFFERGIKNMSTQFRYNYPQIAREAGFRLRQFKDGPVDWKILGSYEIERLLRDQNVDDIDKVLLHLSEAPLGTVLLDSNILEPAIAKYFIVSQFAIQYLLFCRKFLDETVQDLRESHAESEMELARVKKLLSESNNEILQLHKKMTQMEAIHEVIYPCHLCTKNFANNEALNIHIGRKHKTVADRRTDTPIESQKERHRSSDLTLINTIKLELEIKQLKERLNNAEKDIKERKSENDLKNNNNNNNAPMKIETRCVAIQSNLSEEKEKNDSKDYEADDGVALEERNDQLEKLKSKIYSIEEWRATQAANNDDSIAEINRKLADIVKTLDDTKDLKHSLHTHSNEDFHEQPLERRLSVDDLERVLSEKVAEIGKASSEKLEEILHNMEISYREKLIELERELKKAQQELQWRESEEKLQKLVKENEEKTSMAALVETNIKKVRKADNDPIKSDNDDDDDDDDDGNGTYDIETKKEESALSIRKQKTSTAQSSKQTYSKPEEKPKSMNIQDSAPEEQSISDDTSISESLSDDSDHQSIEESEKLPKSLKLQTVEHKESGKVKDSKLKNSKKYTRKDSKNMADKRLAKYGCNMRMKSIPSSTYKRLNTELNEKRNKIKQQYPHFYATRNKIKKFVDKLCTSKSADKTDKMLTTTAALQPMKIPKRLKKQISTRNHQEDYNDDESDVAVDDIKSMKDIFKKRLENLLASPVQRPVRNATTTIAQVHEVKRDGLPMPMPRKRVMFNTSLSKEPNDI